MANGMLERNHTAGGIDARRQGRIAGALYLIVVATGFFSLGFVPSHLAALTETYGLPAAIRMSEPLFRAGMASFALEQIAFLMLPIALYPLLQSSGRHLAAAMIAFVLASIPISFVALSGRYEALALATGTTPSGEAATIVQAAVARAMDAYRRDLLFAHLFWGAWLVPFGLLVLRSRALPAVLGALLVAGGAGYFIDVFGTLLSASYPATAFSGYVLLPAAAGEIGSCAWLLLFGARGSALATTRVASA